MKTNKQAQAEQFESKAAFARRLGVSRSTITRAAQTGRLVLTESGRVEIEASLALWNDSKGDRLDLSEKHAKKRSGGAVKGNQEEVRMVLGERAEYKAMELDYKNKLMRLQADLQSGKLVDKQEAVLAMKQQGRQLRLGLERMVDNLAPQLAAITDRSKRMAMIEESLANIGVFS